MNERSSIIEKHIPINKIINISLSLIYLLLLILPLIINIHIYNQNNELFENHNLTDHVGFIFVNSETDNVFFCHGIRQCIMIVKPTSYNVTTFSVSDYEDSTYITIKTQAKNMMIVLIVLSISIIISLISSIVSSNMYIDVACINNNSYFDTWHTSVPTIFLAISLLLSCALTGFYYDDLYPIVNTINNIHYNSFVNGCNFDLNSAKYNFTSNIDCYYGLIAFGNTEWISIKPNNIQINNNTYNNFIISYLMCLYIVFVGTSLVLLLLLKKYIDKFNICVKY
jgi:hypothetical protein